MRTRESGPSMAQGQNVWADNADNAAISDDQQICTSLNLLMVPQLPI